VGIEGGRSLGVYNTEVCNVKVVCVSVCMYLTYACVYLPAIRSAARGPQHSRGERAGFLTRLVVNYGGGNSQDGWAGLPLLGGLRR